MSQAQKRSDGTGTADGTRRALCREKVRGSTQLAPTRRDQQEDGRAGSPMRIPGGPGLDVVRNLGFGKVGGVLVTGEEAVSNCNCGVADVLRGSREQRAGELPFLAL